MAYESLEVVMSCRFSLSGYLKFIPYYRMTFNLMKLVKGQSFNDGTIESGVVITREEEHFVITSTSKFDDILMGLCFIR